MQIWALAVIAALAGADSTATPVAAAGDLQGAGIPAPPPAHRYVVDEGGVLDSASMRVVDSIAAVRAKAGLPLYVLTIKSVAAEDSSDITFEAFSRKTFDAWRASRPGGDRAAMLVVSVEDRRARIETGPGWGHDHDPMLQRVMEDAIEPSMVRGSLDQGIMAASHEITWVLQAAPVSPWIRDGLAAGGVLLGGALVIGVLRRRRAAAPPAPTAPATVAEPTPRAMAAVDPNLRVSQRMQAISEARKKSEQAASTIAWLDTGAMPKYEGEQPPEAAASPEPEAAADVGDADATGAADRADDEER